MANAEFTIEDVGKKKDTPVGRPRINDDAVVPISAGVDPRMVPILQEIAHSERRTRSLVIAILLEEALEARGLWPPPKAK